jgi:uncharacterized protein
VTELKDIREFLSRKRLAVIGVSRDPKDFTRMLFRELRGRGYELVPVNPNASEVEGVPCFARLADVQPPAEAALLLTASSVTDQVASDCAEAGVGLVWMYRAMGAGAVSESAVRFCESKGIRVIAGECPFMFLPGTGWFHRLHGFCRKLAGRYPR